MKMRVGILTSGGDCPGLYFAGEVLDVDARTGGYNLQIAWATAQAAVRAIGNDT